MAVGAHNVHYRPVCNGTKEKYSWFLVMCAYLKKGLTIRALKEKIMKTTKCTNGEFVNGYWITDGIFDQKSYLNLLCNKLSSKQLGYTRTYKDVFKKFGIKCTMDLHPSQYDRFNTFLDTIN